MCVSILGINLYAYVHFRSSTNCISIKLVRDTVVINPWVFVARYCKPDSFQMKTESGPPRAVLI